MQNFNDNFLGEIEEAFHFYAIVHPAKSSPLEAYYSNRFEVNDHG